MTQLAPDARVAVLAAMVQEMKPFTRRLGLEREPLGDGAAYRGRAGSHPVVAAVTSMGTKAARAVTERLLDAHEVDHVVMIGICGGVSPDLEIGHLLVPEAVVDEATGQRVHPTPPDGTTAAGLLMTTDILHNQPHELAPLIEQGVVAVDMETAAVGAVAEERGIPWTAFRAISDRAGDPDVDPAVLTMSHADGSPNLPAVLRYVATHPHRIPKLAKLGRGMNAAVDATTRAALDFLGVS
jgi:nucleoside phosphorylase